MIYVEESLVQLGIEDWVLRGEPTSESEFNNMFYKIIGVDENESAIESNDQQHFGVTWAEIITKSNELQTQIPLKVLRDERNKKLEQTDWVVTKALESNQTVSQEWIDYRQALRDITKTYTSVDNVVWPSKPV